MALKRWQLVTALVFVIILAGGIGFGLGHRRTEKLNQLAVPVRPTGDSGFKVLRSLDDNTGKTLSLSGRILKQQSTYFLQEQVSKNPSAITLDFSQSKLDPNKYSDDAITDPSVTTPPKNIKGIFKVTGVLKRDKTNAPYLLVSKVEKDEPQ